MKQSVIEYKKIEGGHETFMVGKDMSFFTHDVMNKLKEYHPLDMRVEEPQSNELEGYFHNYMVIEEKDSL